MKNLNQWAYFIVSFLIIFSVSFSVLYFLDYVPQSLKNNTGLFEGVSFKRMFDFKNVFDFSGVTSVFENFFQNKNNENGDVISDSDVVIENLTTKTKPDRIVISKIGVDAKINQPKSVDVAVLDNALTSGAVYYPGSGFIEKGNVFVFGHSTNWKVVQNPAYKTFNGLDKLKSGDEIVLYGESRKYLYQVDSVKLVDADSALVNFDNSKRILTVSTCNTFGEKQERWVVSASFVKVLEM